jgi:hypothetical protein
MCLILAPFSPGLSPGLSPVEPRVSTLGFYEADFVKTRSRKLFSFYFCFILADI